MSRPPLVRLIYASTATFRPQPEAQGIEPTIGRILMQSRRNNARDRVGGVLHFGNGYFFQCLEGEQDTVDRIHHRIARDDRHRDMTTLSMNPISERLFKNWSMKYVAIDSQISALLERAGMKSFDPYAFDDRLVQSLLAAYAGVKDPTEGRIHDPLRDGQGDRKPGLLRRLLGGDPST